MAGSTLISNSGLQHPYDFFLKAPNYVNVIVQTNASSANVIPIVAGAQFMRIAANQDLFLCYGSTLAATAASTVGAGSEFLAYQSGPIHRNLGSSAGTTAISCISTLAAVTVTVSYWTGG